MILSVQRYPQSPLDPPRRKDVSQQRQDRTPLQRSPHPPRHPTRLRLPPRQPLRPRMGHRPVPRLHRPPPASPTTPTAKTMNATSSASSSSRLGSLVMPEGGGGDAVL